VKLAFTLLGAFALGACTATSRVAAASAQPAPIRLAQCDGPATSLPDSLARQLPPRTRRMSPDDRWADLATKIPGGFAGILRDSSLRHIIMLTDTARASAAIAALSGEVGLGLGLLPPIVRQARWDFAQLVDWFNYLLPRLGVPVNGADKDESLNRIRFSVITVEQRDSVVAALSKLPLPCDLVVVDLNGLIVRY
jgi:hypothetical protein